MTAQRTYTGDKAAELFPVLAYDETSKLFVTDDQSLCFGYICYPLKGTDQKAIDRINVLLNGDWPKDTLMQFNLYGGPDINSELNIMTRMRSRTGNQLTKANAQRKKEFFAAGTESPIETSYGTIIRDFKLYITIKIPINNQLPTDSELKKANEKRVSFTSSLKAVGLGAVSMTNDTFVHSMATMLNFTADAAWRRGTKLTADPTELLRNQLLDYSSSIDVDKSYLTLGDPENSDAMYVTNLSIKKYPRIFPFGSAASYIGDYLTGSRGIRGNCMISMTIHFPEPQAAKSALNRKRQWAVNQAYGPMLKFVPLLAAKKHGYDVLFEALDDGDRPIRIHMGLTLFSKSLDARSQAISEAVSYWGELGFNMMEDRFFNLPLFLNRLPFGADRAAIRDTFRFKTMATRHAIPLLPLFADWRGTGTPLLQTISRNGQLINFDLFDSNTNFNAVIAAQSGSGKSFLANELIAEYLAIGGQVWTIDVGRSYIDLCDSYNGDFIEFDEASRICLNPFPLVQSYSEEEDMLVGIVSSMAAPTEKLTDFQTAAVKKGLKEVWDAKGKNLSIDDLAEKYLSHEDRRVKDIGDQLYPFTTNGEYGRFFNGENNVQFKNPFSVLELEELKGRTHLQQVVLLQLIYQIQQDMYLGDRNKRKIVIIDEAWSLLAEGDVAKFIEHGFRRFRKYGGAAIVITQSVSDLYESPTGRAIAENSANMLLLGQKAEAISALEREEKLPIMSGDYKVLKTVTTEKGIFSEIFFMTDKGAGVGRLIVDRFRQLLFSTDAQDVQDIKDLRSQGLSVSEAIEAIIQRRG